VVVGGRRGVGRSPEGGYQSGERALPVDGPPGHGRDDGRSVPGEGERRVLGLGLGALEARREQAATRREVHAGREAAVRVRDESEDPSDLGGREGGVGAVADDDERGERGGSGDVAQRVLDRLPGHGHGGDDHGERDRQRVEPMGEHGVGARGGVDGLPGAGGHRVGLGPAEGDGALDGGAVELRPERLEGADDRRARPGADRVHRVGAEQRGDPRPGGEGLFPGPLDRRADVDADPHRGRFDSCDRVAGPDRDGAGGPGGEGLGQQRSRIGLRHPADRDAADGDTAGDVGGGQQEVTDVEDEDQADDGRTDQPGAPGAQSASRPVPGRALDARDAGGPVGVPGAPRGGAVGRLALRHGRIVRAPLDHPAAARPRHPGRPGTSRA